jgi:hypothetical protein
MKAANPSSLQKIRGKTYKAKSAWRLTVGQLKWSQICWAQLFWQCNAPLLDAISLLVAYQMDVRNLIYGFCVEKLEDKHFYIA